METRGREIVGNVGMAMGINGMMMMIMMTTIVCMVKTGFARYEVIYIPTCLVDQ